MNIKHVTPNEKFYENKDLLEKLGELTNSSGFSAMRDSLEERCITSVWVALRYSRIIGWAMIDDIWHVHVFVEPKYRRRGIGKALVSRANTYARRKKKSLNIEPWSEAGWALYASVNLA